MLTRLVLALALTGSGCSFLELRVPDRRPATGKLDCSVALPVIDTVVAVPAIGAPVAFAIIANSSDGRTAMGGGYAFVFIGLPLLAISIPYVASAIYGYRAHARCQRLTAAPL